MSRELRVRLFASAGKAKVKQNTRVRFLRVPYVTFINSLRSLGALPWKSKLKNQMAPIEEINFDLYESVIAGIETLHFTSWQESL